jgi:hypothetical protein
MAGSRTLKLSILADVDNLKKNLDSGSRDVQTFGDKIGNFGKVAGAAFLVAGAAAAAYAGKLAIDGVKAAIEDEAAQVRLATALQNVTGATDAQIKATEDYILKASLATGVSDDKLRPSLDRLVRSTKSVEEAQKLQTLALNIAAGTGKDLQAVSEALAKAHDGNFTALKKLGGGIDENILKSKDFDAATAALAKTFEGQASKQADTFAGKMDRLKVAFDEGKETIGVFILDAITPIVTLIVEKVVPAVQSFIDGIGGKEGLGQAFKGVADFAQKFFTPIIDGLRFAFDKIKKAVIDNKDEFAALLDFLKKFVAPFLSGALKLAIEGIGLAISVVINFVGKLIAGFEKLIELGGKVKDVLGFGSSPAGASSVPGRSNVPGGFSAIGASSIPNRSQAPVSITINGAIDPISTARQIAQILNTEATLSGTFSNLGGSRLVSSV